MSDKKLLKILCLHGYGQNKESFRVKIGSVRKMLRLFATFEFLDAPFITQDTDPNVPNVQTTEENFVGRTWYDERLGEGPGDRSRKKEGFDQSIQLVQDFMLNNGKFDGIFAFSLGAFLAAYICILRQKNLFKADFQFVILISGYKRDYMANLLEDDKLHFPSLHIIGDADTVVTPDRSEDLTTLFDPEKCTVLHHKGGHYVPASIFKQQYKDFLSKFLKEPRVLLEEADDGDES